MRKQILGFVSVLLFSGVVLGDYEISKQAAKEALEVDAVTVNNESENAYFFVTALEYAADDIEEEFPCFRGVVVNKKTNAPVDPTTEIDVQISFDYSVTTIDGVVVKNCAD